MLETWDKKDLPSFGRRQGRKLRTVKQDLLREVLPGYLLTTEENSNPSEARREAGGSEALGACPQKTWIEIGFGGGEHIHQLALQRPEANIIGGEPYLHGICNLLKLLQTQPAHNLRIVPDDIRPVMQALPAGSVERVYLLFPDPWRKLRHHKRRIFNHHFLDEVARLLPPGGILQLATDHRDYSVWMLEHLLTRKDFRWQANSCHDWQNPPEGWISTRYEQKAKAQGRDAVYLRLIRQ